MQISVVVGFPDGAVLHHEQDREGAVGDAEEVGGLDEVDLVGRQPGFSEKGGGVSSHCLAYPHSECISACLKY